MEENDVSLIPLDPYQGVCAMHGRIKNTPVVILTKMKNKQPLGDSSKSMEEDQITLKKSGRRKNK